MSLIKTKGIEESNKNVQSEEVDVEPTSEESVESVEPNEEIERTPEESVESAEPSEKEKKIAAGAAAVGGILGVLVAGPIMGAAAALGCGALALNKSCAGSEVARSTGESVITTTEKINNDYKVGEKTKEIRSSIVMKAKNFDESHHVSDKTSKGIDGAYNYVASLGSKK